MKRADESEWWYYSGHLAAGDRRFGFHLAFFHGAIDSIRLSRRLPVRFSIPDLWSAHFAVADLSGGEFRYAQRRLPGSCASAGAESMSPTGGRTVWLDDWSAGEEDGRLRLKARMRGARLELDLHPLRPRVRHGHDDGRFHKTERLATVYLSHPRLGASGRLDIGGTSREVAGEVWLDHERGSSGFGEGLAGWDWFAIQFDRRGELMVYGLRDEQHRLTRHACAVLMPGEGGYRRYGAERLRVEPLEWWRSSVTGLSYPVLWRLRLGEDEADLRLRAHLKCCEIDARGSAGIVYWEGPADVEGTLHGHRVSGRAYIEQVARDQGGLLGAFDFAESRIGLTGWLADEYRLRRHGRGVTVRERAG